MWKGSLGFGMVMIPVKLYGATDDRRVSMNQLHTECGSRVRMPKYCPTCDRQVESSEITKAYPIDKENYIPVSPEELESLNLESLKSIQVEAFIDEVEDPRYFKDSYLLSPEEVGVKAFVLFVKAMKAQGKVGIAKIAIREREHLCSLTPFGGVLLLQTLHWGDELRNFDEIVPYTSVSDEEMEMASRLIVGMSKPLELESFKDEYRTALLELIAAKLEGKTIEAPKPRKTEADLAKQLLASLNAIRGGTGEHG